MGDQGLLHSQSKLSVMLGAALMYTKNGEVMSAKKDVFFTHPPPQTVHGHLVQIINGLSHTQDELSYVMKS